MVLIVGHSSELGLWS